MGMEMGKGTRTGMETGMGTGIQMIHFQKDDNEDTTRHLEFVPFGQHYENLLESL